MNNRQTTKRYLPLLWLCLVALLMSCGTMRKASSSQKTPAEEQKDPLTPEQRRKYDYFFLEALRMKEKGDLAVRYWLGKKANEKPLTGHHIGIYGQAFTYDFEWGGKGYMGGEPGGTLWDKTNYAAGVEYGYSLPVANRLNIDFTLGVGYWGGKYYEYIPLDGHYVWQATKKRHWFGPTKAEISLVWLLGKGNSNNKKGGMK